MEGRNRKEGRKKSRRDRKGRAAILPYPASPIYSTLKPELIIYLFIYLFIFLIFFHIDMLQSYKRKWRDYKIHKQTKIHNYN